MFWSADVQHWLGYMAPSFPGSSFIPSVLGTLVFAYGGVVFLRGAVGELADRAPAVSAWQAAFLGLLGAHRLGQTTVRRQRRVR